MDVVLSDHSLLVLLLAAFAAGFVDTLAGGGGLITLPALLLVQIPPLNALATNRLQAACGTLIAVITLWSKRVLPLSGMPSLLLGSLFGAATGTVLIQYVEPRALDLLVPVILFCVALYFLLAPRAGEASERPRLREPYYRYAVIPIIGLYDGALGPGAGSFFSLAGVSLRGQQLVRATAAAKALDFAANAASLLVFALSGKVILLAGAVMIAGQILGAYLGSLAVIRGGAKLIRPVTVIVCCAMLAEYFAQKGLFFL